MKTYIQTYTHTHTQTHTHTHTDRYTKYAVISIQEPYLVWLLGQHYFSSVVIKLPH